MAKQNITRPGIDAKYGYDLEIESSYSRQDGLTYCAYLNGELIDTFYGPTAEADAKQRLYSEVTHQINGGAKPVAATYAELVEARESAYITQRDAEEDLADLKTGLTVHPDYAEKIISAAKATADAYRKALAAIEIYQEEAKDARARMRHETAQMELRAAELQLQVAQARHDAQEPVDESPYGESLEPKIYRQFVEWNAIDVALQPSHESEKPIGYIAIVNDDDGNYEFREGSMDKPYRVYKHQGDAYEVAKTLINDYEYQRPSTQPIYLEMPF